MKTLLRLFAHRHRDKEDSVKKQYIKQLAEAFDVKIEDILKGDDPEKTLKDLADYYDVELPREYIDPVDKIFELQDDPLKAYIWKMKPEVTPNELVSIMSEVRERFIKKNRREPASIHFIANNIEDIKQLDPEDVEEVIGPWLREAKKHRQKQ